MMEWAASASVTSASYVDDVCNGSPEGYRQHHHGIDPRVDGFCIRGIRLRERGGSSVFGLGGRLSSWVGSCHWGHSHAARPEQFLLVKLVGARIGLVPMAAASARALVSFFWLLVTLHPVKQRFGDVRVRPLAHVGDRACGGPDRGHGCRAHAGKGCRSERGVHLFMDRQHAARHVLEVSAVFQPATRISVRRIIIVLVVSLAFSLEVCVVCARARVHVEGEIDDLRAVFVGAGVGGSMPHVKMLEDMRHFSRTEEAQCGHSCWCQRWG